MRQFTGILLLLCVAISAHGQKVQPPRSKKVSASGCVEQGVEAGCLIVRSAKDDKIYNVLFGDGKKPNAGAGIAFEGVEHNGPTTCMQGTAVEVRQWQPVKMECSKHGQPRLKK
jgi:hypothetical protein